MRSPITGKPTATPPLPFSRLTPPEYARPVGIRRIIETDYKLVIPPHTLHQGCDQLSMVEFSECLRDLLRSAREFGVRTNIPWSELNDWEREFVIEGQEDFVEDTGDWYECAASLNGRDRTYKMHVRVFLSRFRHTLTAQTAWAHDFKRDAQLGGKTFQTLQTQSQS